MDTIVKKYFVVFLTAIVLLTFRPVRAVGKLSPEQMDRVTVGIRVTDFANNGVFQARAWAEGTEVSVDTEVGNNFSRAKGNSKSFGANPSSSRAEAHRVPGATAPVPQGRTLPNSRFRFKPRAFKSLTR